MKFTKLERKIEFTTLQKFGILPEEVEGYFDFYENLWKSTKYKKRKIMIINSKKIDKTC